RNQGPRIPRSWGREVVGRIRIRIRTPIRMTRDRPVASRTRRSTLCDASPPECKAHPLDGLALPPSFGVPRRFNLIDFQGAIMLQYDKCPHILINGDALLIKTGPLGLCTSLASKAAKENYENAVYWQLRWLWEQSWTAWVVLDEIEKTAARKNLQVCIVPFT